MNGKSLQSCLTLCNTMDCSLPGSSVYRILQARELEWVAMPSSRGSSRSREQTCISCIGSRFFTTSATWKALKLGTPILLTAVNLACHGSMEESQKSTIEKFLSLPQLGLSW